MPRGSAAAAAVTCRRGAMRQRPCSGPPSRAAKARAESKRGRHSQSMEPSRADERGGMAVADQRIVFDRQRHELSVRFRFVPAAVAWGQ